MPVNITGTQVSAYKRRGDTTVGSETPQDDGLVTLTFPSDANYTVPSASYVNKTYIVAAGVTTATRNLVFPITVGQLILVENRNAQSVVVIGASGTGTTIATLKAAFVYCDGTNWKRASADVTP